MFVLEIPGFKTLRLEHIVLDFNGTVACDGTLLPGVAERLEALRGQLTVHVVTADTFGTVRAQVEGLARIAVLESGDHREEKRALVARLGDESVVAFGNGRNDVAMLQAAALGVALCQREGGAAQALLAADLVCTDILDGLDLLRHPKRLLATLRA